MLITNFKPTLKPTSLSIVSGIYESWYALQLQPCN